MYGNDHCHSLFLKGRGNTALNERSRSRKRAERQKSRNQRKKSVKLSQRSQHILDNRDLNILDYLNEKKTKHSERTKLEYLTQKAEEKKKATFAPQLSARSKRLTKARDTTEKDENGEKVKPILFAALYFDADERKKRQNLNEEQKLKDECTFKPEIREINRLLGEKKESQKEQVDRLAFDHVKKEKVRKEMEARINSMAVSEEKRKRSKTPRRRGLHNQLHSDAKKRVESRKRLAENTKKSKMEKVMETKDFNPESKSIRDHLKHKRLEKMFNTLDSDHDGLISSNKISITEFSLSDIDLITPLLLKIEQIGEEINLQKFIELAEEFLMTISVSERTYLTGPVRQKAAGEKPSFKPSISNRSSRLANNSASRKSRSGKDFAGFLSNEKKQWDEKIREKSRERQSKELEACTFEPDIQGSLERLQNYKTVDTSKIKASMNIRETMTVHRHELSASKSNVQE